MLDLLIKVLWKIGQFIFSKLSEQVFPFLISLLQKKSYQILQSLPPSNKKDTLEGEYGDLVEKLWILDRNLAKKRDIFLARYGKSRRGQICYEWLILWHNIYKLTKITQYGVSFGFSWFRLSLIDWTDTLWMLWVAFEAVRQFDGSMNGSVVVATLPLLKRGAAHIALDENGRVLEWSKSAFNLFGFEANEVINQSSFGLFVPTDLQEIIEQNLLRQPEKFKINVNENLDAKGRRFWLLWINFTFYEQFEVNRITCVGAKISSPQLAKRLIRVYQFFTD